MFLEKIMYLVFTSMARFVRQNRRIFIIAITSLTAACFTVLFVYNLYLYIQSEELNKSRYGRTYSITHQNGISSTGLHQLLTAIDPAEIESIKIQGGLSASQEVVVWGVTEHYDPLLEGEWINRQHSTNKQYVMVVTPGVDSYLRVGSTWRFLEQEYTVIGIIDHFTPEIWIPYPLFLELAQEVIVYNINICFVQKLSEIQAQNFIQLVEQNLPGTRVKFMSVNTEKILMTLTSLAIIAALFILAIINVITLFRYWIEVNRQRFMLYKICGCPNKLISFLILAEAVLLGVIGFGLGSLLYWACKPLLQLWAVWHSMSLGQIIIIFVLYIIAIFISVVGTANAITRANPVNRCIGG